MRKNSTTIEINGQRYDAVSGALLKPSNSQPAAKRSLDGVVSPKKTSLPATAKVHAHPAASSSTPTPKIRPSSAKQPTMDITRLPAKQLHGGAPEHTKTLMRSTVHHPGSTLKRRVKAQAPSSLPVRQPAHEINPKLSITTVDPMRERHAARTAKSKLVSHFSAWTEPSPANAVIAPSPRPVSARTITTQAEQAPPTTNKPKLDIFERALVKADAHEQAPIKLPKDKKVRRFTSRFTGITIATLAIVLVGGFLAYQNMPKINLFVASGKAGFEATLPGYNPAGYDLAKLNYDPGMVAASFHSNSDTRAYTITERTSNWDSTTLRQTFLTTVAGKNYQTVESGGNTIYIYGKHNATWVNGGIWYQVASNGALSDQQLVQLASSM